MMKVFVAHPYTPDMADYRAALSEVEKSFRGVKFQYADMEITSDFVLSKIEAMIEASDFSIYDITGWNPNVTLELGMALGMKRPHYVLFKPKDHGDEVPSDIRGKERIQYRSLTELKGKLAIVIQKHLDLRGVNVSSAYDELRNAALTYIGNKGPVSVTDIAAELKIDQSVARSIVYGLRDEKRVLMEGTTKGAKYRLNEKSKGQN
jgi:hypothetical protein